MDTASAALTANDFYQEWALAGILVLLVIALVQVAYIVLSQKQRKTTAHYLRIREILAGTFKRTLLGEVRTVFKELEDHLPYALIQSGPVEDEPSHFSLLLEKLREADDDAEAGTLLVILQDALAGVLVSRVDSLIDTLEHGGETDGETKFSGPAISFPESTVDDFVYLARALHLTRKHQDRFYLGRKWSRRFLYGLIPSFITLVAGMVFSAYWAYWLAICSLALFGITGLGSLLASSVSLHAFTWLEEKAEAPDTGKLIRTELNA